LAGVDEGKKEDTVDECHQIRSLANFINLDGGMLRKHVKSDQIRDRTVIA
jgi:hypothetical protein